MAEAPGFTPSWRAERLAASPPIAPARSFVYPRRIAGEEDALARGALQAIVWPRTGGSYLISCALGFASPTLPTGLFACPNPDHLCAVAGGYAYLADTTAPELCTLLPLKPVVEVIATAHALLFVGFHNVLAWGREGELWQSERLTSEGIKVTGVTDEALDGLGWDMLTDREFPFSLDLKTGRHTGGPAGAP